jgi:flagellin-like protein
MKANRKFIEGDEAVSAVIGVILMVAITVAIAVNRLSGLFLVLRVKLF